MIQVHLSFFIIGLLIAVDYPHSKQKNTVFLLGNEEWIIWLKFSFSIFSATFGMTRFLKNGPVQQLSSDGPLYGCLTPGFIVTMLIIVSFMASKAIWLILNTRHWCTEEDFRWRYSAECKLRERQEEGESKYFHNF